MKRVVLCILLAIMMLLVACSGQENFFKNNRNLESWFGAPEKIVIYYEGEKETLSKNDEAYAQIIRLLNNKILSSQEDASTEGPSTVDYDYDIYEVEKIRHDGIALDLNYSETMKAKIVCGTDLIERKYNRLFIPLTGHDSNLLFFGNPKIGGNALGCFYENEPLIDFIVQLEKSKE
ncbi:hypothetical protein [Dethiobacter alkaliphilus]|uniref:hypothetical protein n=1 Tax=Dethiobacter alkaliphilus TaxID=427926 RepID=UPI002226EDEB|nr:hypothetical protein [Dethiobacter alkaliphilus]MCW3491626.1 hypothetical protein [Dethiobacter alkaliphilus]